MEFFKGEFGFLTIGVLADFIQEYESFCLLEQFVQHSHS